MDKVRKKKEQKEERRKRNEREKEEEMDAWIARYVDEMDDIMSGIDNDDDNYHKRKVFWIFSLWEQKGVRAEVFPDDPSSADSDTVSVTIGNAKCMAATGVNMKPLAQHQGKMVRREEGEK